jgi:hypothetical protein
MQWTQYITNLAATKLSQPRSQMVKVLEHHLAQLNEQLSTGDTSRVGERIPSTSLSASGEPRMATQAAEQGKGETRSEVSSQNGLAASLNEINALNNDNGVVIRGTATLASSSSDTNGLRMAGARLERPNANVQALHNEMIAGSRWIDVLWRFIVANQRRVLDLDRLGVEPSERMDIQVDMIRQIAATYEKLGLLTRLPDSLHEAHECKKVEDIRTMALVYVARKMMDVASPTEISDENDTNGAGKKMKHAMDFPRSVISPFEAIRPIEFDPAEVLRAAM